MYRYRNNIYMCVYIYVICIDIDIGRYIELFSSCPPPTTFLFQIREQRTHTHTQTHT